jgi:cytidylate kinase
MTAITISRQLGSLGDEVAQEIGKRLKFRVVCRELINQSAIRAGAPEMALAMIDDLGLLGLRPTREARQSYHQAVQTVLTELADAGEVVIVGRAGQVILHDRPDVIHVKVMAPAGLRAERLVRDQSITLAAAQAQVTASDRARRNYLQRYYHVRWDDPELYDLILNTARLDPLQAACLVCQALSQCFIQTDPNG